MPPARRQQAYYTENDVKRLQARRAKAKKEVFAALARARQPHKPQRAGEPPSLLDRPPGAARSGARALVLPRDAIARVSDRLTRAGRPVTAKDANMRELERACAVSAAELKDYQQFLRPASSQSVARSERTRQAKHVEHAEKQQERVEEQREFSRNYAQHTLSYHIIFSKFDVDGSGTIDMGEMYAALAHLGLKISRAAADELLKKYDADGSGELDEAEFTAFCVDAQAR